MASPAEPIMVGVVNALVIYQMPSIFVGESLAGLRDACHANDAAQLGLTRLVPADDYNTT